MLAVMMAESWQPGERLGILKPGVDAHVLGITSVAGMATGELDIGRALVTTVLQIPIAAIAFGFALAPASW